MRNHSTFGEASLTQYAGNIFPSLCICVLNYQTVANPAHAFLRARKQVLPLPKGEGRGEGKGRVVCHVPSNLAAEIHRKDRSEVLGC